MIVRPSAIHAIFALLLLLPPPGEAAQASAPGPLASAGPPPPVPPEVIKRDAAGRATLRAVRLTEPIRLDGRLDETLYSTVPSITGFIQNDPREGQPSEEKTEVWIFFDREQVYVSARCWETHPERMIANEMRRDGSGVIQNDNFAFTFDTFYDRRNAVYFELTPVGGREDGQISNERQVNRDYNPVWMFSVERFEGGWTLETAIPFKSIRYKPGTAQTWGFLARRISKWRNEVSYIVPIPAALGTFGLFRSSLATTLVGIEAPPPAKNLEIKPYAISSLTSDTTATTRIANDPGGNVGIDVKYGVRQSLAADFTYNTDFAQVEADEQQVNLTRFNLSFPEKREFFLENRGIFAFGGATGTVNDDTPVLFYSRRIGLNEGREVPIRAGGRLTGRVGPYTLGVLDIGADKATVSATPATNFSVVRVRRDILRRSNIGALFTGRSKASSRTGSNLAYGLDAAFTLTDVAVVNAYWARSETTGGRGRNSSYRAQFEYNGDRYGLEVDRLVVDPNFDPQVGFVRRRDMRQSYALARFSPRPKSIRSVRKFSWAGSMTYIENAAGRVETRTGLGQFEILFQNGDRFTAEHSLIYEFLPASFRIAPGVTLPVAGYDFRNTHVQFNFGRQRRLSGNVSVDAGTFYNGRKKTIGVSQGRMNFNARFSVEPSYSINQIDLAQGSFTTHLLGSRVTYAMTPWMFASALLQYNSTTNVMSANARLRWEYRPGSEFFIVINEQRDTGTVGFPTLTNRSFIVKINRLFRF